MEDKIKKWRMILGNAADPDENISLDARQQRMDDVLEALYEGNKERGLGPSAPSISHWLGDIRTYFPTRMVQVMQRDALERLGLEQMLLEPELLETIEADVNMVATLLSLKDALPERTKVSARIVVRRVVEELEKRLRSPMQSALKGALNRAARNRRPKPNEIDWNKTILANLKHYQPDYKSIIPERLIGIGKKNTRLKHIILATDQSASMANSVVHSGVIGSILASLRSLRTSLVAFDTEVVDLSEHLEDPVDLLFAVQLGGGTHITKALRYCQQLISSPSDTILVLLSDLMEGYSEREMISILGSLRAQGVQIVCLLSLNDKGAPNFDRQMAQRVASLDIPAFACTPDQFPDLMATAIEKKDIRQWMSQQGIKAKN